MTNLPGSALRKFWNPTAFAFEFLTVLFFSVFCVYLNVFVFFV